MPNKDEDGLAGSTTCAPEVRGQRWYEQTSATILTTELSQLPVPSLRTPTAGAVLAVQPQEPVASQCDGAHLDSPASLTPRHAIRHAPAGTRSIASTCTEHRASSCCHSTWAR